MRGERLEYAALADFHRRTGAVGEGGELLLNAVLRHAKIGRLQAIHVLAFAVRYGERQNAEIHLCVEGRDGFLRQYPCSRKSGCHAGGTHNTSIEVPGEVGHQDQFLAVSFSFPASASSPTERRLRRSAGQSSR